MQHRFFKPIMSILASYCAGIGSACYLKDAKSKNKNTPRLFEPKTLSLYRDYLAPDGSEIRYLQTSKHARQGELVHCRLPPQETSEAVLHKTVEEIWYFLKGTGEMWLKDQHGQEYLINVEGGTALTIAAGTSFQFRNTSEKVPLELIITTMPRWPGPEEAVKIRGRWTPTKNRDELAAKNR